jgi:CheY-like chemotaxis protein
MTSNVVTTGMNVLIADADPIFRALAVSRLIALEARILEAADSAEAWQIARTHKLDVTLVDFDMPGFDGLALTQSLRQHPSTRHIPIIMCTSHAKPAIIQAAVEAGVSWFLTKPVVWTLFERQIRHLLQVSQSAGETSAYIERLEAAHAEKDTLVAGLMAALDRLAIDESALQSGIPPRQVASMREKIMAFAQAYELSQNVLSVALLKAAETSATSEVLSTV